MRTLWLGVLALAVVACSSPPRSRGGDVHLEFNGNNPDLMTRADFEFYGQRKVQGAPDSSFVEVVKGKGTATTGTDRWRLTDAGLPTGRYTWRVAARLTGASPVSSGFSNTADVAVGPNSPSNLLIGQMDATVINFGVIGTVIVFDSGNGRKAKFTWG